MHDRQKPTAAQYVGYVFGRTLPTSLQDWVRNDLVGPGSSVRYVARFTVPLIPIFVLFYVLIPGERWIPLAMMALLLLPVLYFAVALMNIYRRNRLLHHGLDPDLLNERTRRRDERTRQDYESRHGRGTHE